MEAPFWVLSPKKVGNGPLTRLWRVVSALATIGASNTKSTLLGAFCIGGADRNRTDE